MVFESYDNIYSHTFNLYTWFGKTTLKNFFNKLPIKLVQQNKN